MRQRERSSLRGKGPSNAPFYPATVSSLVADSHQSGEEKQAVRLWHQRYDGGNFVVIRCSRNERLSPI